MTLAIGSGGILRCLIGCARCIQRKGEAVSNFYSLRRRKETSCRLTIKCAVLRLHSYQIVILSNQAGLKLHPDPNAKGPKGGTAAITTKVTNFKQKCAAVLAELDLPTTIYAATGRDIYRKPRTGMWDRLCDDYNLGAAEGEIDLESSVFVGDAGGRTARLGDSAAGVPAIAKDFSCSDRNFAHNVGIAYKTPEEFFLGEPPREFARDFDLATYPYAGEGDGEKKSESERESDNAVLFEKTNKQDIVLFCGPPGAGKSTFFWKFLQPLGYERINQDILKTRPKCLKAADEALETGSSVVVGMLSYLSHPPFLHLFLYISPVGISQARIYVIPFVNLV